MDRNWFEEVCLILMPLFPQSRGELPKGFQSFTEPSLFSAKKPWPWHHAGACLWYAAAMNWVHALAWCPPSGSNWVVFFGKKSTVDPFPYTPLLPTPMQGRTTRLVQETPPAAQQNLREKEPKSRKRREKNSGKRTAPPSTRPQGVCRARSGSNCPKWDTHERVAPRRGPRRPCGCWCGGAPPPGLVAEDREAAEPMGHGGGGSPRVW